MRIITTFTRNVLVPGFRISQKQEYIGNLM
jgi:hypothetical protein